MGSRRDYVVRLTGKMPDGKSVDRKFERVEDALEMSQQMAIVNLQYLKVIARR
jgi:hypothetical protein